MPKLLLIDDDYEVLNMNQKYLTNEGFTVFTASKPENGIENAKIEKPDCIILDIMMPQMNGYEVCSQIRSFSNAPIIFLTGRDNEDDKIRGLSSGADDYIVKPYSLRELKVRIDVILRRFHISRTMTITNTLICHNLLIDKLLHKAFYKGDDLCLANREYEVLLYFAQHPNKEITFEELGTALFGFYQESDRQSVMVNVSRLRKKMNINYELENMIETVWSKGYRFIKK